LSSIRSFASAIVGSAEGLIGAGILAAFVIMALFGPNLAHYDPTYIGTGPPDVGPSGSFLLGTDSLGRDVLSRLLYGASSVMLTPLIATLIAFAVGGLTGLVAGYLGGTFDAIVGRAIDILLALPPLLIVLVIIASFGSATGVIIISVAAVYSPRVARILRGATQGVATREYILAAQARGERTLPIVLREVLPNIAPTVLVEFAVRLTYVIIFITTLNFLGLGLHPPSPNWGLMVAQSRPTLLVNPVPTLAPTIAIGALSVSIGLIADAITRAYGIEKQSDLLR
jgi:peptide/nickel transport system permease protein